MTIFRYDNIVAIFTFGVAIFGILFFVAVGIRMMIPQDATKTPATTKRVQIQLPASCVSTEVSIDAAQRQIYIVCKNGTVYNIRGY